MRPAKVDKDRADGPAIAEDHLKAAGVNLVVVPLIRGMPWIQLVGELAAALAEQFLDHTLIELCSNQRENVVNSEHESDNGPMFSGRLGTEPRLIRKDRF